MKKLLSLMLCIVLVCFALVSCAEDVIGEYLPNYDTDNNNSNQIEELNLYIITDDMTAELADTEASGTKVSALTTVSQYINSYLKEKYDIELNIVFCKESEYESTLYSALEATEEDERPDIVLINSKEMFNKLHYQEDVLVSLNDFYNHRDFKSINTKVDRALLSASSVIDPVSGLPTYYTVPNNHIIGEYKYVVINKSMARDTLHFSNEEILSMNDEASLTELYNAIRSYYQSNPSVSGVSEDEFVAQNIQIVSGNYSDKLVLEYGVETFDEASAAKANNEVTINYVNINSYPVATKDEAFSGAFAIVKSLSDSLSLNEEERAEYVSHYTKCMKIIYALNSDSQLLNMLQYGYVGTTYINDRENEKFIKLREGDNYKDVYYRMNPLYTGNIMIAHYCQQISWNGKTISWNEQVQQDILKQNADCKQPEAELKLQEELADFEIGFTSVSSDSKAILPIYSDTYNDVIVAWSLEEGSEDVIIIDAYGNITFTKDLNADTTVTLVATIRVGSNADVSQTKTFELTLIKADK